MYDGTTWKGWRWGTQPKKLNERKWNDILATLLLNAKPGKHSIFISARNLQDHSRYSTRMHVSRGK